MSLVILITTTASQFATASDKTKTVKAYFFGHSLVWHTLYQTPTPKDHTSIPHWLGVFADAGGHDFSADGQFGFLPNHAELPPRDQWGFAHVDSAWKGSFGNSGYNTVILTAANFDQWQSPKNNFPGTNTSAYAATLKLVDYAAKEAPGSTIYIYEHWPEIDSYFEGFPKSMPGEKDVARYMDYWRGEFHDWWVDYYTMVKKARPDNKLVLMPVGPVFSELMLNSPLKTLKLDAYFEDGAPHGLPITYFLAAMIKYQIMFGEKAPKPSPFPETVNPLVDKHYAEISEIIATQLKKWTP